MLNRAEIFILSTDTLDTNPACDSLLNRDYGYVSVHTISNFPHALSGLAAEQ